MNTELPYYLLHIPKGTRHMHNGSLTSVVAQIIEENKSGNETLMQLSAEDAEDVEQSIKTIGNRGNGLLKFVNTYRSLSKVPDPVIERVNLYDLVDLIQYLFKPDFEAANIAVSLSLETDDAYLQADPNLIDQVLINLCKNAKEALSDATQPKIECKIQREFGRVCLYIRDNGPGMDAETLGRVFIPFYTTKEQGSGIGLSLSRQMMRQHNGSIQVKSELGQGTTFRLEF